MNEHKVSIRIDLDFYLNAALKIKAKEAGVNKKDYIIALIENNISDKENEDTNQKVNAWLPSSPEHQAQ